MEIDGFSITAVILLISIIFGWALFIWIEIYHISVSLNDIKDLLEEERKDRVNKQRRQV